VCSRRGAIQIHVYLYLYIYLSIHWQADRRTGGMQCLMRVSTESPRNKILVWKPAFIILFRQTFIYDWDHFKIWRSVCVSIHVDNLDAFLCLQYD